jgi:hypothetical protein
MWENWQQHQRVRLESAYSPGNHVTLSFRKQRLDPANRQKYHPTPSSCEYTSASKKPIRKVAMEDALLLER